MLAVPLESEVPSIIVCCTLLYFCDVGPEGSKPLHEKLRSQGWIDLHLNIAVGQCQQINPLTFRSVPFQTQLQEARNPLTSGKVGCSPFPTVYGFQPGAGCYQSRCSLELSRLDGLHQRRAAVPGCSWEADIGVYTPP